MFEIENNKECLKNMSQQCKELIVKLLQKKANKRANLEQLLTTSWVISNRHNGFYKTNIPRIGSMNSLQSKCASEGKSLNNQNLQTFMHPRRGVSWNSDIGGKLHPSNVVL